MVLMAERSMHAPSDGTWSVAAHTHNAMMHLSTTLVSGLLLFPSCELQIADLPVEEYEALWSEYVNAYAEHLLKADNDPTSPAGKRLVRFKDRLCWSGWSPAWLRSRIAARAGPQLPPM